MQGPQAQAGVRIQMQMGYPARLLGVEKFNEDIDRADHKASLAARLAQRNHRVLNLSAENSLHEYLFNPYRGYLRAKVCQ